LPVAGHSAEAVTACGGCALKINTLAWLALLLGLVAVPTALLGGSHHGTPARSRLAHSQPAPLALGVQLDASHPGARVPGRFLGLSFEVASAGQIAGFASSGDLTTLLRSLGPGVLRLGGISADTRSAWVGAHTRRPAWASGVMDAGELHGLAKLARASGWRVLLTIGLAHYNPAVAAREAAVAKAILGGSLMGIELGNEPDAYSVHGLRPSWWSDAHYDAESRNYRRAIAAVAPGIAVAGPGVSGSSAFELWGPAEVRAQRPALLTGHHYPLGCHSKTPATIANLLSVPTRVLEEQSLTRYLAVSGSSHIPFRMDETNSVSCGGKAGVSDTFAAALWATNYIAHTMAAGASGINLQGNPARCSGYSPVCAPTPQALTSGELRAQPEWYALLLTHSLIGDRPLRAALAPTTRNITVNAFRAPGGALSVVVVDDDPLSFSGVALRLHVGGGYALASVLALRAPGPGSVAGVQLGGRGVAGDGSWSQPATLPHTSAADGVVSVDVAPSSAALITVSPAR
jgi:hypothetical protein